MANWLQFDRISHWEVSVLHGFQYDSITDTDIAEALQDRDRLMNVDCNIDWENDRWLARNEEIQDSKKHAYRVASLIEAMTSGRLLQKSINLDTYSNGSCCSCVCDGHHRIRALQYLGLQAGPFSLSGLVDALEELVAIAGVVAPRGSEKYVAAELLVTTHEDIVMTELAKKTPKPK